MSPFAGSQCLSHEGALALRLAWRCRNVLKTNNFKHMYSYTLNAWAFNYLLWYTNILINFTWVWDLKLVCQPPAVCQIRIIMTIRNSKSAYYTHLFERLISNHNSSKDWWKTLKEYMCPNRKETIPNIINPGTNEPTTTDLKKAECINDFLLGKPRLMLTLTLVALSTMSRWH